LLLAPGGGQKQKRPAKGRAASIRVCHSGVRPASAVMHRMQFSRLVAMVLRVEMMGMGDVGVMPRLFMMAVLVRLRGFAMVLRRVLVMFRRLLMVLCLLCVRHVVLD
jgi:hypothetical protein